MSSLQYIWSELFRRLGRTITTALGFAAGVSLVVSIMGVASGLATAQDRLLSPLSTVGTDIIVTRTVGATTSTSSPSPSPSPSAGTSPGSARPRQGGFFGGGGSAISSLNAADQSALLQSNESVLTDLSKLGPPGTQFTHDFFVPGTLITFPSQAVTDIASIPGVASAVGELSLQGVHDTGTVPKIVATFTTGGQSQTVTSTPPPLTAAQQAAVRSCLFQQLQAQNSSTSSSSSSPGSAPSSGGAFRPRKFSDFNAVLAECLPASYLKYQQQVVTPIQTVQKIINPPQTNLNTRSYTVAGVNPAVRNQGVITSNQLVAGTWFTSSPKDEVLVNQAYASTNTLKVGSTIAINGTTFHAVGIVAPTLTGNVSDLYFDLTTLQSMATQTGRINEVFISARSASDVNAIAAAIHKKLPGAQILTAKSLDEGVTGSLADAHTLAASLGTALAIVILLGSFLIAILLTLSNVNKRVREIGSLRAMGWSRSRVVRQLLGETVGISVIGGVLGLLIGFAICTIIDATGPALQATISGLAVGASTLGSTFGQPTSASSISTVHVTAPLTLPILLLGFGAAVLGGIIAGTIGGWRAAQLSPAEALRNLG